MAAAHRAPRGRRRSRAHELPRAARGASAVVLVAALLFGAAPLGAAVECSDYPVGWVDSVGFGCAEYTATQSCTADGQYGEGWNVDTDGTFEERANGGYNAFTACCGCGGGMTKTTTTATATTTSSTLSTTSSTGTTSTSSSSTATQTSSTTTLTTSTTSSSSVTSSTTSSATTTSTSLTTTTSMTTTATTTTVSTTTSSSTTSSRTTSTSTSSTRTSSTSTTNSTTSTTSTATTSTSTRTTATSTTTSSRTATSSTTTVSSTTSTTSTTTISTTTTTTPPLTEALLLVDEGAPDDRCGVDGEYWMVGKSHGVPDKYIGQAPVYIRREPTESAAAGAGYSPDPSSDLYYLFFGLDCWSLPQWGSNPFSPPSGTCDDGDVECHLGRACWARIQCQGVGFLDSMWLVVVYSPEWPASCPAFARLDSDDPLAPPSSASWQVMCPDADPPVTQLAPRPLSFSELVTTTTATHTATTVSTTTTTTIHVEVLLQVTPKVAQPCNRATFTPVVTSGGLAPVTFEWSWGPNTPGAVQAVLQGALDEANAPDLGAREISVPLASLDAVVAQGTVTLEVQVLARNREGTQASALARLQVRKGDPPPTLAAVGPTVLSAAPGEEVRLAVATGETAPACSSRQVAVRWEYMSQADGLWRNLTDVTPPLTSTSRVSRILLLPPYTFPAMSLHMFRAYVGFTTEAGEARWSEVPPVVLRLIVGAEPPPAPRILGPSLLSRTCGFEVQAELPDVAAASLSYRWSCTLESPMGFPDACSALPNFMPGNADKEDGTGLNGATLRAEAGLLMAGLYTFTVRVARQGNDGGLSESSASWTVQLLGSAVRPRVPPVVLHVPWEDRERLSVSSEMGLPKVAASIEVTETETCSVPATMQLQWVLVHLTLPTPLIVAGLASVVWRMSANGKQSLRVSTEDLPGGRMLPGEAYKFALLRADDAVLLSALYGFLGSVPPVPYNATLLGPLLDTLEAAAEESPPGRPALPTTALRHLNASVAEWSPAFIADRPPEDGRVTVAPDSGYALRTSFSVLTGGWSDDQNVDELEYTFYSLPLDAGPCETVDWQDSSSPRHWARLGGRLLRAWSPSPALEGLRLPPGSFQLAARARDRLGASAAACAAVAVEVAPPAEGLSEGEVRDLFSGALAARSADGLLSAVDIVADTVAGGGFSAAAAGFIVPEVMDMLDMAVQIMDPAPQLLEQFGLAVARVVAGAGTAVLGFGGLDRSLAFLSQGLGLFMAEPTGTLGRPAGDALLGGLLAVDRGLEAPKASREEEKQAEAASLQLLSLVELLGRGARQGLAVDGLRELAGPGVKLELGRLAIGAGDLLMPGVRLPAAAVAAAVAQARARRRLQAAACDAEALDVQRTVWRGVNPFRHVANERSYNADVLASATVVTLRYYLCGQELHFDLPAPEEPLGVLVPEVQPFAGVLPEDYKEVTTCLMFDTDPAKLIWIDKFTDSSVELCSGGASCPCVAYRGGGAYAAINRPVPAFTTTATATSTSSRPLAAAAAEEEGSSLGVALALVGSFVFVTVLTGALLLYRWRRRKKLSRVAAAAEAAAAEDDEQQKTFEPKLFVPQEDEEIRRQVEELRRVERQFQELRTRALEGDAHARKELMTRAKLAASPSPQLVAAVDELMQAMKRERAEAVVRERAGRTQRLRDIAGARMAGQPSPLQPQVPPALAPLPARLAQSPQARGVHGLGTLDRA